MMDFTLFNPIRQLEAIISNIQPKGKYFSPSFDVEKLAFYQLCFELSPKHFCFWVKDTTCQQIIWVEEYALPILDDEASIVDNISLIYGSHEFLKSIKWHSIRIIIDSQYFTQVPLAFFRKDYQHRYLQLAKGSALTNQEEILCTVDDNLDLVHIYSVESELVNWFSETYPLVELQFAHLTDILVDYATKSTKANSGLLCIQEDSFLLVVTSAGKLKLCNRFTYKTYQDILFYVMVVCHELNLKADEIMLRLYGQVDEKGELQQLLEEYIKNVHIGDQQNTTVVFEGLSPNKYIGMLNL